MERLRNGLSDSDLEHTLDGYRLENTVLKDTNAKLQREFEVKCEFESKFALCLAKCQDLETSLFNMRAEMDKNKKEYGSHIAIAEIENKQLHGRLSNQHMELESMKKEVQVAKNQVIGKVLIEENLRELIAQGDEERKDLMQELHQTKAETVRLEKLCREKDEYVDILRNRLTRETEMNASLQQDLDMSVVNQETAMATLEENVLILENDLRVLTHRAGKEAEKARMEKLSLTIKLQVNIYIHIHIHTLYTHMLCYAACSRYFDMLTLFY
jgi:hypothetical protein